VVGTSYGLQLPTPPADRPDKALRAGAELEWEETGVAWV
jgi:hypothetical protein